MLLVYDLHQAQSMTLRAEEFEKHSSANNFRRAIIYASPQTDKGKGQAKNLTYTTPSQRATSIQPRGVATGSNTVQQRNNTNPYARPVPGNYYRCQKSGHRSNECPERRAMNLVEDSDPKEGVDLDEE